MLRRLLLGLLEGLLIGLALGVGAARGLELRAPGTVVLLVLGAAAGFVVGLVAGRPVWSRDGKTEALLKASAGALGGAALSFGAQHWFKVPVDLSAFQLGAGPVGRLSAAVLPMVATTLALFFELDDDGAGGTAARVSSAGKKQRVSSRVQPNAELAEFELDDTADTEQRRGKH